MINWIKYTKFYFLFSGILIVIGIYSLWNWGLKPGVDFTGGSLIEYKFKNEISTEKITEGFNGSPVTISSVQEVGDGSYLLRTNPLAPEEKSSVTDVISEVAGDGNFEEVRFETVGPTIGPELIKKTIYASLIAAGGILFWVAFQFKNLKFGAAAVLAMLHDSFMLVSSFSLFGHFFATEVDFLFVTALLTTLSFSVHDTIVVFDRIRELKRVKGGRIGDLANEALTETMVRSLNNSFTIIFMLVALILLGGTTVKWFAVALLVGTVFGTYSSPFIAVPLLAIWDKKSGK